MYGHMSGPHTSSIGNPKVMGCRDWGLDHQPRFDGPWCQSSLWDQFRCKANDQTRKVRHARKVQHVRMVWHPVSINKKLSSSKSTGQEDA